MKTRFGFGKGDHRNENFPGAQYVPGDMLKSRYGQFLHTLIASYEFTMIYCGGEKKQIFLLLRHIDNALIRYDYWELSKLVDHIK